MRQRWHFRAVGAVALLAAWCLNAYSDEIAWLPGEQPELSLQEKLKKRMVEGRLGVVGTFVLAEPPPGLAGAKDGIAILRLRLNVDRIPTSEALQKGTILELKLPVFVPQGAKVSPTPAEVLAAKKALWDLERKLEGRMIVRDAYLKAIEEPRDVIVRSSDYLKTHILVPVRIGTMESWHRLAYVPVALVTEPYAVFLVTPGVYGLPQINGEVDVYPAAEREVTRFVGTD